METGQDLAFWESLIIFLISLFLVSGIYLIVQIYVPRYLTEIAKRNVWWSPLRNVPPPNMYAEIRKNAPDGPLDRYIHNVYKHYLDENYNFIPRKKKQRDEMNPRPENAQGDVVEPPKKPNLLSRVLQSIGRSAFNLVGNTEYEEDSDPRSFWHKYWNDKGFEWVGLFRYYGIKPVEYPVREKLIGANQEYKVVLKKRNQTPADPYYLFRYTSLYIEIPKIEIKGIKGDDSSQGAFSVTLGVVVTVCHMNPYKAQFVAEDWVDRARTLVERVLREYSHDKDFDHMRKLKEGKDPRQDPLQIALDEATHYEETSRPDESDEEHTFLGLYGLTFKDPELVVVELEKDPEMEKAQKQKAIAKAGVEAADARNEEKIKLAQGEAQRISTVYGAISAHPNGAFIALTEAFKEGKPQVIVLGNTQFPVPTVDLKK